MNRAVKMGESRYYEIYYRRKSMEVFAISDKTINMLRAKKLWTVILTVVISMVIVGSLLFFSMINSGIEIEIFIISFCTSAVIISLAVFISLRFSLKLFNEEAIVMKRLFSLIIVFSVSTNAIMAQEMYIQLGSSLEKFTDSITSETKVEKVNLGTWSENEICSYEISPEYSILFSANNIPFGVLDRKNAPRYLIDTDGDYILDIESNFLYVPYWVVSLNSKEKNDNRNVIELFGLLYETFQNNEAPLTSAPSLNFAKEVTKAGNDLSYMNRDLIYLYYLYSVFYSYDVLHNSGSQYGLRYLYDLDNEISSRFGTETHIMVYIFLVETLYRGETFHMAKAINDILLRRFPDCVHGLVYQVLLERNTSVRNSRREILLRDHGEHWFVKEKLL
jgi:hypothetical protein